MVFFGLFDDKNDDLPKHNFVAVHCRRFDCSPPYDCLLEHSSNFKTYGQWALQIGNLFYEIVEPRSAIASRLLHSMSDESLRKAACTLGDLSSCLEIAGEDNRECLRLSVVQMLQSGAGLEEDVPQLDREDDPFITCPNRPGKGVAGEAGDEGLVPLVISKAREWRVLPKSEHAIIPMRTLPIHSGRGISEARYTYNAVFRWGYDAFSHNSQAFVLYLLFAMKVPFEKLQYDQLLYWTMWENSQQRLFKDPSIDFPNLGASLIVYKMWRDITGEPEVDSKVKWEEDAGPAERNWEMDWKEVRYRHIVPPGWMRDSFENRPPHSNVSLDVQIDTRSHAAHAMRQVRHDLVQHRPNILNGAVMRQLRTEYSRELEKGESCNASQSSRDGHTK